MSDSSFYEGPNPTIKGEVRRTLEMLEDMQSDGNDLYFMLVFLRDTGTCEPSARMNALIEVACERMKKKRRSDQSEVESENSAQPGIDKLSESSGVLSARQRERIKANLINHICREG